LPTYFAFHLLSRLFESNYYLSYYYILNTRITYTIITQQSMGGLPMGKINDLIVLGMLSGLLAGIPGKLLNLAEYHFRLTDMTYTQHASTLFLSKDESNRWAGKLVGSMTNTMGLFLVGITTSSLLVRTGRDFGPLKGIGVAYMYGLLLEGVFPRMGMVAKPRKPLSYPLALIDHTILGSLCGLLASKLGSDSLFSS